MEEKMKKAMKKAATGILCVSLLLASALPAFAGSYGVYDKISGETIWYIGVTADSFKEFDGEVLTIPETQEELMTISDTHGIQFIPEELQGKPIEYLATENIGYHDGIFAPTVKEIRLSNHIKEIAGASIDEDIFFSAFTNLESIWADSEYFISVDGVLFTRDMTKLVAYPRKKPGESYTIPDTVKKIGDGAFQYNEYLKHIEMPKALEQEIMGSTFDGAKSLENLTVPEGVQKIYELLYSENSALKTVTLPSTLEDMRMGMLVGEAMLRSLPNLENIFVAEGNKHYKSVDGVLLENQRRYIDGETGDRHIYYDIYGSAYELTGDWKICVIPAKKVLTAHATDQKILIDGKEVQCEAYNICGCNYFKLRDMAYLLNGTARQFNITWNGEHNYVSIDRNTPYEIIGGECTLGDGTDKTPYRSTTSIGSLYNTTYFNINGNNYVSIRDIGLEANFGVAYDEANNAVVISTDKDYEQ